MSLRFALLRIALATVAVGFLVLFLTPVEVHSGLMTAAIAIALFLAATALFRAWREASGPANVWLDDAGLHWLDAGGREQLLPRSLVRSFLIGHDAETRRDLMSLTFVLDGGFLSQPAELHAPADEARVRQWLQERCTLSESAGLTPERLSTGLFCELDFHDQRWLIEGSPAELHKFADALADAAKWPLPPTGARPKQLDIEFAGQPMTLAVAPHTWLDGHYFSASPELLEHLSSEITAQLSSDPPREQFEIPLETDSGHHWRMIFGVAKD